MLVITNLVFGILSLSGIQISGLIDYQNFPSFKDIGGIFKSIYGLLFILPGILSFIFSLVTTLIQSRHSLKTTLII